VGSPSFSLWVILGSNGLGKSTILKPLARIYDPTERTILVDGQDIKASRLADLRRAMTILFQDYTLFPLSVNISAHALYPSSPMHVNKSERTMPLAILLTHMVMPQSSKLRSWAARQRLSLVSQTALVLTSSCPSLICTRGYRMGRGHSLGGR
jgi:ABC-type cobalamin/Fe3+-siderophores transport system ATPase subunit